MMAGTLAPIAGRARIEVLDVLRGLAILGIFYMNIPGMAQNMPRIINDLHAIGWTPADRWCWYGVQIFLEGTQRGMLELLFGAGMMVLTAKAMEPDGPVSVADLYYRRNLWLLAFGLADVFAMLWVGDILHIYALAALFLFPFRLLKPRWLLALGLAFAAFTAVSGSVKYAERVDLRESAAAVAQRAASGATLTAADRKVQAEWKKKGSPPLPPAIVESEVRAHHGGLVLFVTNQWAIWKMLVTEQGLTFWSVIEAFCVMLIGIAFWKWGIIQGARSNRLYLALLVGCYLFGIGARAIGAAEMDSLTAGPRTFWITNELARIAMSVGHVALVNLAIRSRVGHAVLSPFRAAGRVAFSLYFLTSLLGIWVFFAPWGLVGWGRLGWAAMTGFATIVIAALLVVANLWVRHFANGPLEWAWRSLAYVRWQPFRKRVSEAAEPLPGPNALPA